MKLGHLLTRSGLTYPEVSSKVYNDSFCQLDSSVSLPWVICFEAFYLHVVSSLSCISIICPKLVLVYDQNRIYGQKPGIFGDVFVLFLNLKFTDKSS